MTVTIPKVKPAEDNEVMDVLSDNAKRMMTRRLRQQWQVLEVQHHVQAGTLDCLAYGPNQSSSSSVGPERCNEKDKRLHSNEVVR